jgi:hypothetical protein
LTSSLIRSRSSFAVIPRALMSQMCARSNRRRDRKAPCCRGRDFKPRGPGSPVLALGGAAGWRVRRTKSLDRGRTLARRAAGRCAVGVTCQRRSAARSHKGRTGEAGWKACTEHQLFPVGSVTLRRLSIIQRQ